MIYLEDITTEQEATEVVENELLDDAIESTETYPNSKKRRMIKRVSKDVNMLMKKASVKKWKVVKRLLTKMKLRLDEAADECKETGDIWN